MKIAPGWTLSRLANCLNLSYSGPDHVIHGVALDSRNVMPGDLFIAIEGDKVDGHQFIDDAMAKGAVACLGRHQQVATPTFQVPCVMKALATWANTHRQSLSCPVIGITGSTGKTSTREILSHTLSLVGQTVSAPNNYNTQWTVPLVILSASQDTQYLVLEMGICHQGDMQHLVDMVAPSHGILVGIGPVHLETMGSIEAIAAEKYTLLQGVGSAGIVVAPKDQWWDQFAKTLQAHGMTVGAEGDWQSHQVSLSQTQSTWQAIQKNTNEVLDITLNRAGKHSIHNALCCLALLKSLNIPNEIISQGFATVPDTPGRLFPKPLPSGQIVIDDAYNANPQSLQSAIDVLANYPGRTALVISAMAELGEAAKAHHVAIGQYAKQQGIDGLLAIGPWVDFTAKAFGEGANIFAAMPSIQALSDWLSPFDVILFKGSHSTGMHVLVKEFLESVSMETSK